MGILLSSVTFYCAKNKFAAYFLLISLASGFFSCGGDNSKNPVPTVDNKVFNDFFKFDLPADVKNFNYYADELGIDASYWISFDCDESTVKKIHQILDLHEGEAGRGLFGGLNSYPTLWWDTTFLFNARPFTKREEQIFWFIWYDKKNRKAYFLTFDV